LGPKWYRKPPVRIVERLQGQAEELCNMIN
jgi:hypothetical protein